MSSKQTNLSKRTKIVYRETLEPIERARYDGKLTLIGGIVNDPYELKSFSEDVNLLPAVTYPDIVNYLVFTPSPYTTDDLKCYKGLEAYNQFVCGWVSGVKSVIIDNKHVVKAKVLHSQRLREKSLNAWVIAEANGRILASHCDCMAGVGEVCSHVASVLFAIEGTVHIRDARTVTQEPAYWLLPSSLKKVEYSETRNINFTSSKTMKKTFDSLCENPVSVTSSAKKGKVRVVPEPTSDDVALFFNKLHATGRKPVILSVVPKYAEAYRPKVEQLKFPKALADFKTKSALSLNYKSLLDVCSTLSLSVTDEEISNVEMSTRQQSASKLWYKFRAGRITASKIKAVYSTDPSNPSQSLVMSICYPSEHGFSSAATSWGIKHEKQAVENFVNVFIAEGHENVTVETCGLFISKEYPWIAATPDGIISCDCCGRSKCPYSVKDSVLANSKYAHMKHDENGDLRLEKSSDYYHQIQTQLGVTKCDSAYFVVWTEKDIHIEEVVFDKTVWDDIVSKSHHIFQTAVLPELVGKFFSRLPGAGVPTTPLASTSSANDINVATCDEKTWCYCDQVESDEMVYCDNENCDIKWFHFNCLKITSKPKSKYWYCPDCRKQPEYSRKRTKRC